MNDSPAARGPARYQAPDWVTRHVFNPAVAGATRLGWSLRGSRILEIPGRRTGTPRRTPVNPLTLEGTTYLVAPRGETEWVRNLRANGDHLVLIKGRHRQAWTATALDDAAKAPILRAYLERWKSETGRFFEGVGPDSPDADLAAIAPRHPVFRLDEIAEAA